ncbi:protein translocase subunit SecD [soil metagenome]
MRRKLWTTFVIILALTGFAAYVNWPSVGKLGTRDITLRQGLDLKGGAYFVYEADTSGLEAGKASEALETVRSVFDSRINTLGVTEPELRIGQAGDKPTLIVSLPGVSDITKAKSILGTTAKLEFRDEAGEVVLEGKDIVADKTSAEPSGGATSGGLAASTSWEVKLTLTAEGKTKFAKATAANLNKQIAIVLDEQVISAPTVQSAITDGEARITGSFTAETARDFALQLKSGALPVPVKLVQEQTVGATLGSDAINESIIAGFIAIFLVMLFMIAYYKWCGLIASLALIVYVLLNVMMFRLLPVTLTLAGIAGFVISIGIAVDTNILTFERLKEELRLGKQTPLAVKEAFRRSWTSIRDSHVAGLISASIIFIFATGGVRGFAVVLIIGTLLSLFTAITVTRNWMLLLAGSSKFQHLLKP